LGCRFPGHSAVEATHDLSNFLTWQKTSNLPLLEIYKEQAKELVKKINGGEFKIN